jgi:glycosyltransferase involved in cell wall biosynthesis
MLDDVIDAYLRMDVVVNPMIGGTGLKIKTVEGLAYGRPVLSTKAGASGLSIEHPDLLHEDIDSLVERIHELAKSPEEAITLAEQMQSSYSRFFLEATSNLQGAMREIVLGRGQNEIARAEGYSTPRHKRRRTDSRISDSAETLTRSGR